MIVWDIAFTIAYTDGSIAEIGMVQDAYNQRLTAGTMQDLQVAIALPKFVTFLTELGVGGTPFLPANVRDYTFRFNAVTTSGEAVSVIGSDDTIDGHLVSKGSTQELIADPGFASIFVTVDTDFEFFDGTSIWDADPNSNVPMQVDDAISPVNLPFTFQFYAAAQTLFNVSSNGFITFSLTPNQGCCNGRPLPENGIGGLIAGYWTDITLGYNDEQAGNVSPSPRRRVNYTVLGTAPNRRMIISWENVSLINTSAQDLTFQIKLYETTNVIEIHHKSCNPSVVAHVADVSGFSQGGIINNGNGAIGLVLNIDDPTITIKVLEGTWADTGTIHDISMTIATTYTREFDEHEVTVGIDNLDGTKGIAYQNAVTPPPILINKTVRFTPNGNDYIMTHN